MTSQPAEAFEAPAGTASRPWLDHYPDGVSWNMTFQPAPLTTLLDQSAAKHGARPCTSFFGRSLSYAEIAKQAAQAAEGLQALGIGKGDRVGLLLPNSPTFIVYYFAILRIGGIVVNFNPLYTESELEEQARDCGIKVMVTLDLAATFDKAEALLGAKAVPHVVVASFAALLPSTKSVLFRLIKARQLSHPERSRYRDQITFDTKLRNNAGQPTPVEIDPVRDTAVLQYTGGTTGTPKGAMLSHANLLANTQQVIAWAPGLVPGKERMFGALPFFHVFAMTVVMNFAIGQAAEIVIMPRFVLDDALKLITKTKPTIMPGVPTLFNAMAHHPKIANFDLSSLHFCISGGAALPLEVKHAFETLTGAKLVEGYGLTEASPVLCCNPAEGRNKEGSIGVPFPLTDVSLRDLDDPTKVVAPGERGELCAKGPQVMLGYWQRTEETDSTFVDGWLRTGDVAVMDDEGYFFIVDRIKDLIICSGYNVYPRRIEDALYSHEAVEEATVIGIPDDYRGEAPKAFVKLHAGSTATREDLMAHLRVKLSKIELPAEIELRSELPKTLIGKLSKKELRSEKPPEQTTS